MFLISDTNNFERRTKVKSFVRKGKVVRSYDRSIRDRLRDVTIGATGTALLGGAYLLGKRNGAKSLDDVKSLIKNIKPEVTVNVPTPIVNVTNTPSVVREVVNSNVNNKLDNAVKATGDVIKLDVTRIPLRQKIDNLSKATITKTANEAAKMDEFKLDKTINLISSRLKKYNVSNDELVKLDGLILDLKQLKTGKFNRPSEREYLRKQIIQTRDYFKLPKLEPEDLNVESIVDKEYSSKLKKLINREKSILDIYQSELTKRRKPIEVRVPTDDDINRLSGLLDEFSNSRKLVLFSNVKPRHSFFLTDTIVSKRSNLL